MHRIIIAGKNADLGPTPIQDAAGREVSKDEFFAKIKHLNVHPLIVTSSYPYTSEWRMQDGSRALVGRTIGRVESGVFKQSYFLEGTP